MSKLGTYVRFDSNPTRLITWAARTGLASLSDKELEAVYTRAHDFIRENKDRLVNEHKWTEYEAEGDEIQRPSMIDYDLIVAGPKSLCNIFYMLQRIAPGMLLLACVDDHEDGLPEHLRALPIVGWVSHHQDSLTTFLGSDQVYRDLLEASREYMRSLYYVRRAESHDSPHYRLDDVWQDVYVKPECWRDNRSSSSEEELVAHGSDLEWCGHYESESDWDWWANYD